MYRLTSPPHSRGAGWLVPLLLLLVAKGQRKNNVFRCLCIHYMLAPWSISDSCNDCICTWPAWCHGDFPEPLHPGLHTGQRSHASFHHRGVRLAEEAWDERRPQLLGDSLRGFHPALPWVFGAVGQDGLPTQSPGPGPAQGAVLRTSVFCIRLDAQNGVQFFRGEPQQVLQVTHEAVHVPFA